MLGRWSRVWPAVLGLLCAVGVFPSVRAQELPDANKAKTVELFRVPNYCEGVCFDHEGNGYVSWGKSITKFSLDGKNSVWTETGAPNGHKVLADGTHLVCDASQHAVLKLAADGKQLDPASKECDGKPLRGPNDLTLDTANGGFYFSDPGGSSIDNPIGTIHYVDKAGKTTLLDDGLAFPTASSSRPTARNCILPRAKKTASWCTT